MEEKDYGTLLYNLKELKKLGGNPLIFEEKICALKDPKLSYWFFTEVKGSNKKVHRQIILDSKNIKYNYEIAKKIQDTCFLFRGRPKRKIIREHGQVVIDNGSLYYNLIFAKNIKCADVRAHGQVIINSGNPNSNCDFARSVPGADIEAHWEVVKNSSSFCRDTFRQTVKLPKKMLEKMIENKLHYVEESQKGTGASIKK